MRNRNQRPFLAALVLAPLLFAAGCGIESYQQLDFPYNSSSGSNIVIKHVTSNTSIYFQGYEIYYKIYCGPSLAEAPASIATDASSIEANWSTIDPGTVINRLKNANYKTIYGSNSTPPLIAISRENLAKDVTASIDLASGAGAIKVDNALSLSFSVYRNENVRDSNGDYIPFVTTPMLSESGDTDTSSGTTYFYVRAYAVAYGNTDSFQPIYSMPVNVIASVLLNP